jgi:DNA-binding MarR family transcriptional regulator
MLGAIALTGPASVTRLAERLALDRTTLTRNLKVLAEQGMISIAAGEDRRERVVELTGEGQAAIDRATPVWQAAQAALVEKFGEERWRRMIEDMSELAALPDDTGSG